MKTASILTIAGVTLVTGAVAYAVYFDTKRRTDAAFRKKLRASSYISYFERAWTYMPGV